MVHVNGEGLSRGLVIAVVVGLLGLPAIAQEAGETEPELAAEETPRLVAVEEIVVTAQKRAENVQDVPVAISTLGGEDLELLTVGTPDVRMLSARVPSLILESSFGRAFPRFYIRGLGNTDFDLNASQPVSMIVDDVILENPVVKGMPLFDLEQVEVLRGPQGTLFGRNTPAGIVKFDTKKPSQLFDASFRASYGTFDTFDVNGGVGGALTDTLSARFSGLYQSQGDWIDNRFTGEKDALGGYETTAYRLQLLWQPSESFRALVNVHGWELDGTARVFRANILEPGTNNLVAGFDQEVVYHDGRNKQEISAQGGVLKLEYDFEGAVLTSVTGFETLDMYSRGDIDGGFGAGFLGEGNYGPGFIPFPSESADGIPELDQLTQELRLASIGKNRVDWLVGVFYFDEDFTAETFNYDSLAPGNPEAGYAFQSQKAEAYALFASIDYALTDLWDLKVGLRYSHDEKDFSAERPIPTFNTPTVAPITRSVDDDVLTWDLSTVYKVRPNVNVYGRLATSYRAPSIQGRILFCADFDGGANPDTNCVTVADTEEILSLEFGVKSILMDQRLRLNLTGYVYEVDGQQVTAVGGVTNTARLLNIDTTKGYGLEADIELTPTANWLMTFGLSYNPTEIDDPSLRVTPCGGGCTVTDPVDALGAIVHGNSLPHAPEVIFNGIVSFRSDAVNKGFFGALDWAYYSEKSFFLYESEEFNGDSFEVGIRLGYGWDQARYEVALFGRNLTDEKIVRNGIDFNNLTGMMNDPRMIGVEFVGRF